MSTTKPKIVIGQYVHAADGTKGIVLEVRESAAGPVYSVVDSNGRVRSHQEWSIEPVQSRL